MNDNLVLVAMSSEQVLSHIPQQLSTYFIGIYLMHHSRKIAYYSSHPSLKLRASKSLLVNHLKSYHEVLLLFTFYIELLELRVTLIAAFFSLNRIPVCHNLHDLIESLIILLNE